MADDNNDYIIVFFNNKTYKGRLKIIILNNDRSLK